MAESPPERSPGVLSRIGSWLAWGWGSLPPGGDVPSSETQQDSEEEAPDEDSRETRSPSTPSTGRNENECSAVAEIRDHTPVPAERSPSLTRNAKHLIIDSGGGGGSGERSRGHTSQVYLEETSEESDSEPLIHTSVKQSKDSQSPKSYRRTEPNATFSEPAQVTSDLSDQQEPDQMGRRRSGKRRRSSHGDGGGDKSKSPSASQPTSPATTSLATSPETAWAESAFEEAPKTVPEISQREDPNSPGAGNCEDIRGAEWIEERLSEDATEAFSSLDGPVHSTLASVTDTDMDEETFLRLTETPESKRRSLKVSHSEKFFAKRVVVTSVTHTEDQDEKTKADSPDPELAKAEDRTRCVESKQGGTKVKSNLQVGRIADKISLFESQATKTAKSSSTNPRHQDTTAARNVTHLRQFTEAAGTQSSSAPPKQSIKERSLNFSAGQRGDEKFTLPSGTSTRTFNGGPSKTLGHTESQFSEKFGKSTAKTDTRREKPEVKPKPPLNIDQTDSKSHNATTIVSTLSESTSDTKVENKEVEKGSSLPTVSSPTDETQQVKSPTRTGSRSKKRRSKDTAQPLSPTSKNKQEMGQDKQEVEDKKSNSVTNIPSKHPTDAKNKDEYLKSTLQKVTSKNSGEEISNEKLREPPKRVITADLMAGTENTPDTDPKRLKSPQTDKKFQKEMKSMDEKEIENRNSYFKTKTVTSTSRTQPSLSFASREKNSKTETQTEQKDSETEEQRKNTTKNPAVQRSSERERGESQKNRDTIVNTLFGEPKKPDPSVTKEEKPPSPEDLKEANSKNPFEPASNSSASVSRKAVMQYRESETEMRPEKDAATCVSKVRRISKYGSKSEEEQTPSKPSHKTDEKDCGSETTRQNKSEDNMAKTIDQNTENNTTETLKDNNGNSTSKPSKQNVEEELKSNTAKESKQKETSAVKPRDSTVNTTSRRKDSSTELTNQTTEKDSSTELTNQTTEKEAFTNRALITLNPALVKKQNDQLDIIISPQDPPTEGRGHKRGVSSPQSQSESREEQKARKAANERDLKQEQEGIKTNIKSKGDTTETKSKIINSEMTSVVNGDLYSEERDGDQQSGDKILCCRNENTFPAIQSKNENISANEKATSLSSRVNESSTKQTGQANLKTTAKLALTETAFSLPASSNDKTAPPSASLNETTSTLPSNKKTTSSGPKAPPPLASATEKTTPPPISTNKKTTPPPILSNEKTTPLPVSSNEKTTPPPASSNEKTTPPPISTNEKTTPPPISTNEKTTPPPASSNEKTTPPPISTNEKTTPPPISSNEKTTPPPISSNEKTTPPPISSNEKTTPPPISSNEKTTPPPISTNEKTTPPPASSNEKTTPPPISSNEKTTPPLASSTEKTTPPPISSNEKTTPPPISTNEKTTPPPISTNEKTTPPPASSNDKTTPPPVSTNEKTTPPPASSNDKTPPPPISTTEKSTPPPASSIEKVTSLSISTNEKTKPSLASLNEKATPPPASSTEKTTPPPASSTEKTTPPPASSNEKTTPPPASSNEKTTPPPASSNEKTTPPPISTNEKTTPPPISTNEKTTPPPISTNEKTTPPPASSNEKTTPPPASSNEKTTPPPISSNEKTTPPPISTNEKTTPPPISSNEKTTPPPASSTEKTTPPPASSTEKTTPPPISTNEKTTPPPISSNEKTTPPPISTNEKTTPPPASSNDQNMPPQASDNDKVSHTLASANEKSPTPLSLIKPQSSDPATRRKKFIPKPFFLPQIPSAPGKAALSRDSPSSWLDVERPVRKQQSFPDRKPKISSSVSETNLLEASREFDPDDFVANVKRLAMPFTLPQRKHKQHRLQAPSFAMPPIREDRNEKPFDPEDFQHGLRRRREFTLDLTPTVLSRSQNAEAKEEDNKPKRVNPERPSILTRSLLFKRAKMAEEEEGEKELQSDESKTEPVKVRSRLERCSILSSLRSPTKTRRMEFLSPTESPSDVVFSPSDAPGFPQSQTTQPKATVESLKQNTVAEIMDSKSSTQTDDQVNLKPAKDDGPVISPLSDQTVTMAAEARPAGCKQTGVQVNLKPDSNRPAMTPDPKTTPQNLTMATDTDALPPLPSFDDIKLPSYLEKFVPKEPETAQPSQRIDSRGSREKATGPGLEGVNKTVNIQATDNNVQIPPVKIPVARGFHRRPGKIVIFEHHQFSGQSFEFFRDEADATHLQLSSVISVKVVRGCWILYEKPGFEGRCIALEEEELTELPNEWAEEAGQTSVPFVIGSARLAVRDFTPPRIELFSEPAGRGRISEYFADAEEVSAFGLPQSTGSIRVHSGLWLVFSDPGFQGLLAVLEAGEYPCPEAWGFPMPAVGSLRALRMGGLKVQHPNAVKAVLFEKAGLQGRCVEVQEDVFSFRGTDRDFRDTDGHGLSSVESLKILRGLWVGYELEGFEGQQFVLEEGEYLDWRDWGGTGQKLLSLRPVLTDFSSPHMKMFSDLDFSELGLNLDLLEPLENAADTNYGPQTRSVNVLSGAWVVFEEPGLSGELYVLEKGLYSRPEDWGSNSSRISSAIPVILENQSSSHFKIQLFSESDLCGASLLLEDSLPTMPDGFITASCRVLAGSWLAFGHESFSGVQCVIEEGDYPDLRMMGFTHPETSVRSLQPTGHEFSLPSIVLFERSGFRGRRTVLKCSSVNLQLTESCTRVSSILVEGGMWVLYESHNFRGSQVLLKPGEVPDWSKLFTWPRIGSLRPLIQKQVHLRLRNKEAGLMMSVVGTLGDLMRIQATEETGEIEQIWIYQDGHLQCKCLASCFVDVSSGVLMAGSRAVLSSEPDKPPQLWNITSDGLIRNNTAPNLVLEVKGGQQFDKTHIILNEFNPNQIRQRWSLEIL